MKVQVLVATMHQTDHSLIEKMNIQSDAIVGNQCDINKIEDFQFNGHKIKYLHFAERGISVNRNNALLRSDGDICLLADDDMIYDDNYADTVISAFNSHPDADVLIFNIREPVITRSVITKPTRVNYFNYLRYGSVRIAFKTQSIKENGIFFNVCFGTGTKRGFGEDNLFLTACLNKKLKVIALPISIAQLTEERESTWFSSYDDTYLKNKGMLFKAISRRWSWFLCLQDALRHHKTYGISFFKAYTVMRNR